MKYFHVLCGNLHIDLVRASSEAEAIHKIECLFGKASRYKANAAYVAIKA